MRNRVQQLHDAGLGTNEIASKLGIKPSSVTYHKKKLGIDTKQGYINWSEVQQKHNDGMSYRQLAAEFGISKSSIEAARKRGDFVKVERVKKTPEQIQARKREAWQRYQARKKKQTPANADIPAMQKFYENCPVGCEVDHIIPLSKGGLHTLENLQYLTITENRRKGNKLL